MITNVIPGFRIKVLIKISFRLQSLVSDLASVDYLNEGLKTLNLRVGSWSTSFVRADKIAGALDFRHQLILLLSCALYETGQVTGETIHSTVDSAHVLVPYRSPIAIYSSL
jgi:hypothetical protein